MRFLGWRTGYAPEAVDAYRAERRALRNLVQQFQARIEELTRIVGSEK